LHGGVIDKRKLNETEKSSGELMYFHSGEPHESIYKGFPVRSINIELESNFFRENEIDESNLNDAFTTNPNSKFSMLKIYKELSANDNFSDTSIEMLLIGLITDNKFVEKIRPNWINKVCELLHDNWNDELSLNELAFVANVHPKTISKYFPAYFNCTLGEYRRKIKIEKAISMIRNKNLSLTEIAYECGFYDQSHFTATFKDVTGFRPKEFQKL
jgi:AraC family transcriptional regulator